MCPLWVKLKICMFFRRWQKKYFCLDFSVKEKQRCRNIIIDRSSQTAWTCNSSLSLVHVFQAKLALIMQMILLMKALSYSAGGPLEGNVSMSLDPRSNPPPPTPHPSLVRAGSHPALTAVMQPAQRQRGWQLQKNPFPEWAFCWGRYADLWGVW